MTVLHVVGARPNFMKAAPVYRALAKSGFDQVLVHTGQHYDALMSDVFFQTLEIPAPDESLNVGSGHTRSRRLRSCRSSSPSCSHASLMSCSSTGTSTRRLRPPWCARSSESASLTSRRACGLSIARCRRRSTGLSPISSPTSCSRRLPMADENLKREGVAAEKIFLVGNVMIDTLVQFLPKAEELFGGLKERLSLDRFGLVTLHRPSNVDDEAVFLPMLQVLDELSRDLPLIFPVHPRTRDRWSQQLKQCNPNLRTVEPLGYLEFLALQKHAAVVITDSGGIQEETTYLGTPCLTLRENTERPITITAGTNVLIGRDWKLLREEFARSLNGYRKQSGSIPLWDGHASDRIAEILSRYGNPSSR